MSQLALRASDEDPGQTWVLATRPALGTMEVRAAATHLVKASPRSITTAVFSPPLPRPSYSGMMIKGTVRRTHHRHGSERPRLSGGGAGGGVPSDGEPAIATAGASLGGGAPAPDCPRLCLIPRRAHSLTGAPVSSIREEEMRRLPLIWVQGARGTRWVETTRRIGHPEWGGADSRVLHAGHALKWRLGWRVSVRVWRNLSYLGGDHFNS